MVVFIAIQSPFFVIMSSPDVVPFEETQPGVTSVPESVALQCANWFTEVLGKCQSVTKVTPLADALQNFIDWITIIGCAFFLIVFLNRLIGFYNRRCEKIDKNVMWRNYLCYACALLLIGTAAGFMSKMLSYMNLKANPFMIAFNALWSQSYVIVWLAVGLIQLHYIDIWIVRFKDLNLNVGRFKYSWVVMIAAAILCALSITYDLYINIITEKYKSQNAYYVRVGWILMSLPYMLLGVLSALMFPVCQKLRYTKGSLLGEMLFMWSMIILCASAFSVLVIYYFEFFPAGLSLFVSTKRAFLMNATLKSYVIRLLVLLCNYIMLGACIYALSFASYVHMPIIGEIYYFAMPARRAIVYEKERMLRAEMGFVEWSNSSSSKEGTSSHDRRMSVMLANATPPPSPPAKRHDYSRVTRSRSKNSVDEEMAQPPLNMHPNDQSLFESSD